MSLAAVSSIVLGSVFSGQAGIQRSTIERRITALRTDLAELELKMIEATTPSAIVARAHRLGLTLPNEIGVIDPARRRKG